MSSYLEYVIERKNEDRKWTAVAESHADDLLNIVNPYIIKSIMYDIDCYQIENPNISKEAWRMFTHKIERQEQYGHEYPYQYEAKTIRDFYYTFEPNNDSRESVISAVEHMLQTEYRHNDLELVCDISNIAKNKDEKELLLALLCFKNIDLYYKFVEETDKDKLKDILIQEGCRLNGDLLTFIYEDTPFSLIQTLKYSQYAKKGNIIIRQITPVGYFESNKEVAQYRYEYKVSYRGGIISILKDIEKRIRDYELNLNAENLAKRYIDEILDEYKNEKHSDIYKALKKYSKNYIESTDDEYYEELLLQKAEFEKVLMLMGDNGRLLWNIDY